MVDANVTLLGMNGSSPNITLALVNQIVTTVLTNVLPFVDVFGIVGNILCICICLGPRLRRAPWLHLTAMAFYDLLFLFGRVPFTFAGAKLIMRTNFGCRTFMFMICVSYFLSSWTVMAFTVERFIIVYFPLHRAALCTFKHTVIIILCLIPIPLLYNCYIFVIYSNNDRGVCDVGREFFVLHYWLMIIDTVISTLIPLITIFTLNGMIAYRLWKNDRKRKGNQELRLHLSNTTATSSRSVTRSLIIVSTTFAVLNVPINAIVLRGNYVVAFGSEKDWTEFDHMFEMVAILLYHINFATDFLLYNFSSKLFRKAAMDFLVPKRVRQIWRNRSLQISSFISSRFATTTNL